MNYFAVETRTREPDIAVVELVIRSANEIGMKSSKVDALDRFRIGSTEFMRFRIKEPTKPLTDHLEGLGRGVVVLDGTTFIAKSKSKTGTVSATIMFATPRTSVVYRGPGAQYWERQFESGRT